MIKGNTLSLLVTIFGAVFICELVTMQFIYNSMNFLRTPLSPYATGEFWYIISSGLLLIGTSYFILAYLFMKHEKDTSKGIKTGSFLLIITGVCTYSLTLFYTDIGPTTTIRGHIHLISAHLHFIFLPLAIIVISSNLKGIFWKKYKLYSLCFASLLIAVGLLLVFKRNLGLFPYSGIIQKTLIFAITIWIILSAQIHGRLSTDKVQNEITSN